MSFKNLDVEAIARQDPAALTRVWARQCWTDFTSAEVVRALNSVGIRPVLLKGPVIAGWLYAEQPALRGYVDIDIFVAPDDHARATATLRRLGFTRSQSPALIPDRNNVEFFREDGANVDLHHTLHGLEHLDRSRIWSLISDHLVPFEVAGQAVQAPDPVLRTLNVVMHLSQADGPRTKAWRDLIRALDRVDAGTWAAAAALARQYDAEAEMAARLRRVPGGSALAARLELTDQASVSYEVRSAVDAGVVPRSVLSLHFLLGLRRTPMTALHYGLRKLFPPVEQLRRDFPDLASSRRGLLLARGLRLREILRTLPEALGAYRRLRRIDGSSHRPSRAG